MEITVKDGEREVTVRDKRPVLEPGIFVELLAAVRAHLDSQDAEPTVAILPFGFNQDDADPGGGNGEDGRPAAKATTSSVAVRTCRASGSFPGMSPRCLQ
jgi:hypothetical protein